MTVGALGFQTIWNTGVESTFGTAVTTDRSYEIVSESVTRKNKTLRREGMRGGTISAYVGTRRVQTGQTVDGNVVLEVLPIGMGRIFQQITGSAPTITTPGGGTLTRQHVYALGSLANDSLTIQKVIRDPDGTVVTTITQKGCKVTAAEFAISVDQMLRLTLDIDGQSEVKNIAAAAAAYPSATVDPYHFAQASLTVNGVAAANVSVASVKFERPLNVDRYYFGNAGLKDEQVEEDRPKESGTLTADVINETLYDLFVADGGGTLVLTFIGSLIEGALFNTLTITVPDIHLTEGTPAVSGPGLLTGQHPWESDAGGATITYITTDTAA